MRFYFSKNIIVAALSLATLSCSKTPEACFTPEEATIEFGATHTLTNCSKGGSIVNVNWGDGIFGEQGVLSHQYTAPGYYTIDLTVMTANQKKYDETSVNVTVSEPNMELFTTNWTNYKVELFTTTAQDLINQTFGTSANQGTDLNKESTYYQDVDFKYIFSGSSVTVTDAEGDSETGFWSSSTGAMVYIQGDPYQIVSISSNEMILRADDLTQFSKYDTEGQYENIGDIEGYVLFYFRR